MESKSIVAEEIRNINSIIKEELGINDDVQRISETVLKEVVNNKEGRQKYQFSFNGKTISIFLIFNDYEHSSDIPIENKKIYGVSDFSNDRIIVYGYRINGRLNKPNFMEVLTHEILHFYNVSVSGSNGLLKSDRSKKIYYTSTNIIMDNNASKEEKIIAYSIYMSYKFENNAFGNGLYSYLKSRDDVFYDKNSIMNAVVESKFYRRLEILKKANEIIENNKDAAQKIAEQKYGKTYEWLKKIIDFSIKNCRRQIGRAVSKYNKDWPFGRNIEILV